VGGSADSWQNQLTFFSALGYEVIAPDLLGHGFSSTPDRPKAYTFTKLFRDTLTIFDHFCVSGGRQNPCVVIGHSYGGSIATALARSRPEQIKVLVGNQNLFCFVYFPHECLKTIPFIPKFQCNFPFLHISAITFFLNCQTK
jgi:pimeloyl-ACP methyl ester carboxylesterase